MKENEPQLLAEVIRNMIDHQPELIMVDEVIDPIKLLHAVRKTSVDVVIVAPLQENGIPKICSDLLAEHPRMKIVTLSSKGETAYLYHSAAGKQRINEPSGQLLFDTGQEVL